MKKVDLAQGRKFNPLHMHRNPVHDSENFRIINFNLAAGQVFPVHSHDTDGELSIVVIEGEGSSSGEGTPRSPRRRARSFLQIRSARVRATTDMRILVTIAPPL